MCERARVFYNSFGPSEMYAMIRSRVPAGFELVTLDSDSDVEREAKIADCEIVIVAARPLGAQLIAAAGHLRLVHHQGVGYQDTVAVDALARRGIRLAITPEGTTVGVAEHAVLLTLAAARRLPYADAELRQGRWHVNSLRPLSIEIAGKTVGYLGFGRIGRETAQRFRVFGTRGLYHDPQVSLSEAEEERYGVRSVDFATLLAGADILSLHLPLTAATHHIVDRVAIAAMRPGAILINTARGGLIDEEALAEALEEGHLLAAGLDVFEQEPQPASSRLAALPNVVLTPHISAGTRDALLHKMDAVFANLERFRRGEALHNEIRLDSHAAE